MQNRRNYYRLLQVQPDAPLAVIKASYRAMMQKLKMHPDLGGSHELAAMINQAYQVLCDSQARAEYDEELLKQILHDMPKAVHQQRETQADNHTSTQTPEQPQTSPRQHNPLTAQYERVAQLSPLSADINADKSQRQFQRTDLNCLIHYRNNKSTPAQRGILQNFSPAGIQMLAWQALTVGASVQLDCDYFRASGEVRSIQALETGYLMGIAFTQVQFNDDAGKLLSRRS